MMQYNKPYSFEKTDVRGRFLLKFSTTNVKLETVSPIAANIRFPQFANLTYSYRFTHINNC